MKQIIIILLCLSHSLFGQTSDSLEFNKELSNSIIRMGKLDQTASGLPINEMTWDEFTIYKDSIFHLNYSQIKTIFNSHGYLGYKEIGQSAETYYWVIIQHCDFDITFQSNVLVSMKTQVDKNNANSRHYGLLYDRVMINSSKKQLYGTQVQYNAETGQAYPKSLEDSLNVNLHRKELGFESLEKYLNKMTISHYNMNKESLNERGILTPILYEINEQ